MGKRTLEEVIRKGIDYRLSSLRVALPGKVVSYDPTTQTAEVQPMLNPAFEVDDGILVDDLSSIPGVPVCFEAGGGFAVTMPLAAGDEGMLVFADFSLDYWRSSGLQAAPEDMRVHGIGGAAFWPGLHGDAKTLVGASAADMVILHKSGQFIVLGTGATDFVVLETKLIAKYNAHTHPTGMGPSGPPTVALAVGDTGATVVKAL